MAEWKKRGFGVWVLFFLVWLIGVFSCVWKKKRRKEKERVWEKERRNGAGRGEKERINGAGR
jgi:hypothetical protein